MPAAEMFAALAVGAEDLLDYDEPPGWYLSSRAHYGATLYLATKYKEALDVFKEDLVRRPNNSRSLFGLWKTFAAMGAAREGKVALAEFRAQWPDKNPDPKIEDL